MLLAALTAPSSLKAQHKLSTDEAAKKTPDQRYVYESERKAKKKKNKKLSTKQKVRVQEKQEKAVRKKKPAKH